MEHRLCTELLLTVPVISLRSRALKQSLVYAMLVSSQMMSKSGPSHARPDNTHRWLRSKRSKLTFGFISLTFCSWYSLSSIHWMNESFIHSFLSFYLFVVILSLSVEERVLQLIAQSFMRLFRRFVSFVIQTHIRLYSIDSKDLSQMSDELIKWNKNQITNDMINICNYFSEQTIRLNEWTK